VISVAAGGAREQDGANSASFPVPANETNDARMLADQRAQGGGAARFGRKFAGLSTGRPTRRLSGARVCEYVCLERESGALVIELAHLRKQIKPAARARPA
jgi:hypothetical protein